MSTKTPQSSNDLDTLDVVRKKSPFADIELNRIVSDPLKVKELKEGEVAVYKLIIADYQDISRRDTNEKPLYCKPGMSLHHNQKIYDPIKRRVVNIRNIEGYSAVTLPSGEEKLNPVLKRFIFPKGGVRTVTHEQMDTYAWMERHNGNRDNPYRDKRKKPLFYRVNAARQAMRELENDYILTDSLVYVRDAGLDKLKAMYENLTPSARKDINPNSPETLKRGIFEYTKNNPILAMKASDNKDVRLKIQVMEAEHFNVIAFDEGDESSNAERRWYFLDDKMTEICTVDVSVHKIDGLIEHFKTKEGYKQHYLLMANRLEKVLNPR